VWFSPRPQPTRPPKLPKMRNDNWMMSKPDSTNVYIDPDQEWIPLEKAGDLKMFNCPKCGGLLVLIVGLTVTSQCSKCGQFYSLRRKVSN